MATRRHDPRTPAHHRETASPQGPVRFAKPSDVVRAAARGVLQREYLVPPRLADVMEHICTGKPTDQVASDLALAPATVRDYALQLYQILSVHRREQLVAFWLCLVYEAIDAFKLDQQTSDARPFTPAMPLTRPRTAE